MWKEEDFKQLIALQAQAPPGVMGRLQRRLRVLQTGRELLERQAFAFWIVLDTLLRIFFGKRNPVVPPPRQPK